MAFLHAEAELMASMFVPRALRTYLKSWVLSWDAGVPPRGTREEWLQPAVSNHIGVKRLVPDAGANPVSLYELPFRQRGTP